MTLFYRIQLERMILASIFSTRHAMLGVIDILKPGNFIGKIDLDGENYINHSEIYRAAFNLFPDNSIDILSIHQILNVKSEFELPLLNNLIDMQRNSLIYNSGIKYHSLILLQEDVKIKSIAYLDSRIIHYKKRQTSKNENELSLLNKISDLKDLKSQIETNDLFESLQLTEKFLKSFGYEIEGAFFERYNTVLNDNKIKQIKQRNHVEMLLDKIEGLEYYSYSNKKQVGIITNLLRKICFEPNASPKILHKLYQLQLN